MALPKRRHSRSRTRKRRAHDFLTGPSVGPVPSVVSRKCRISYVQVAEHIKEKLFISSETNSINWIRQSCEDSP